jgi:hypothetical protein
MNDEELSALFLSSPRANVVVFHIQFHSFNPSSSVFVCLLAAVSVHCLRQSSNLLLIHHLIAHFFILSLSLLSGFVYVIFHSDYC